jgi:hypothetical protein
MHNDHPELLKDQYWDELPKNLPDHAKSEVLKKEKSKVDETKDFFDVPVKTSLRNMVSLVNDVESTKTSDENQEPLCSSQVTCSSEILQSKEKLIEIKPTTFEVNRRSKASFFIPQSQTRSNLTSIAESEVSKSSQKAVEPRASIIPRVSLVPRASIIDSIYKKRPGVEAEQSIIERKMEIKRIESTVNIPPKQGESFSEDESEEDFNTGPIVHTSFSSKD